MLNAKELYYFNKAKEISEESDFKKIHIGCIAVYKGKIIATSCNSNKSHPIQKKYDSYRDLTYNNGVEPKHCIHAEMKCLNYIKDFNIKWNKVKLFIYRKNMNDKLAICRPCESCMEFIKKLGIKHIYYTSDNGYCYELLKN